jgi:hypothetical protein
VDAISITSERLKPLLRELKTIDLSSSRPRPAPSLHGSSEYELFDIGWEEVVLDLLSMEILYEFLKELGRRCEEPK